MLESEVKGGWVRALQASGCACLSCALAFARPQAWATQLAAQQYCGLQQSAAARAGRVGEALWTWYSDLAAAPPCKSAVDGW